MWAAVCLLGGSVVCLLCLLSAGVAKERERAKQWKREAQEREELAQIMARVDAITDDDLVELLHVGPDKK